MVYRSLSTVAVHRSQGFAIVSILWKGIVFDRHLARGADKYVAIDPSFKNQ